MRALCVGVVVGGALAAAPGAMAESNPSCVGTLAQATAPQSAGAVGALISQEAQSSPGPFGQTVRQGAQQKEPCPGPQ